MSVILSACGNDISVFVLSGGCCYTEIDNMRLLSGLTEWDTGPAI